MFEDSLFSSRRQRVSLRKRWTTVVSISAQLMLTAAVILVPMLRPEMLPMLSIAPALVTLPRPVPPPVVRPREIPQPNSNTSAMQIPSMTRVETIRGSLPSHSPTANESDGPALLAFGKGMGDGLPGGLGIVGSGDSGGSRVTVAAAKAVGKPRVSAGVSAGMLLQPIRPVYPSIANAAHVEGTVVVTATIDKSGRIVGLQVVSGPAMLRGAAVDAVKDARYRPFLLNGEPTEVETTISVNFRIGG